MGPCFYSGESPTVARLTIWLTILWLMPVSLSAERVPTFRSHISPLLLRSGCNDIRCHGAAEGQAGFKLSLRSMNSADDFLAVRERIDRSNWEKSLFWQKPTATIEHEGGVRWQPDGTEAVWVQGWIKNGAALGDDGPPVRLQTPQFIHCEPGSDATVNVLALGEHGERWDVSSLCEVSIGDLSIAKLGPTGTIRGLRKGFCGVSFSYRGKVAYSQLIVAFSEKVSEPDNRNGPAGASQYLVQTTVPTNPIDRFTAETLALLDAQPADTAKLSVLVRRVYFDLLGRPPTDVEFQRWLGLSDDQSTDQIIDEVIGELIQSDAFAVKWGRWFSELMGLDVSRLGSASYAMQVDAEKLAYQWMAWNRDRIAQDRPLAELIAGHITATSRDGMSIGEYEQKFMDWCQSMRSGDWETSFVEQPTNDLFWKAFNQDGNVPSEWIGRRILGVDLQCARCHDHPNADVTRASHQSLTTAFAGMVYQEQTLTGSEKLGALYASVAALAVILMVLGGVAWRQSGTGVSTVHKQLGRRLSLVFLTGMIAGACAFLIFSYLHLLWPTVTANRFGAGLSIHQILSKWVSDRWLIVIGVLGCVVLIGFGWRWRRRAVAGTCAAAAALFIGLCISDLVYTSPDFGGQASSWVHALHRQGLAAFGMGGQGAQPREIYRSLEARSVDFADLQALDILDIHIQSFGSVSADPRADLAQFFVADDPQQRMARNLVNRVWQQVFGVGLVEPAGDMSARHPPSHPALLDDLTKRFIAQQWSLKWLIAEILGSRTYRRSSSGNAAAGTQSWCLFTPRMLDANERFELIKHVTRVAAPVHSLFGPADATAQQSFVGIRIRTPVDRMLQSLRFSQPNSAEEVPLQTVQLGLDSSLVEQMLQSPGGRAFALAESIRRLIDNDASSGVSMAQTIDAVVLNTLGRHATPQELIFAVEYFQTADDLSAASSDFVWTLLNAEECYLNY